ncbi:MAG TPA: hypothetical protein VNA17_12320 [Pyrinomonadaceae bacterium]|nr:hypothetical protein [Pyrinomonadaceae bacterium]
MRRSLVLSWVLFAFHFGAFAQDKAADGPEKEKQQQTDLLLSQVAAEIPNLRLSENRSIVYARIGSILWLTDQKQARAMFQNAVAEMVNALENAGTIKKNNPYQHEILTGQATRPQILSTIAARDAVFALDALYRTRPPMVAEALAYRPDTNKKISSQAQNYANIAQNEMQLEQSFFKLAAEQNPERAAKLLKESLQKGLSYETFALLSKLYEKDPAAADELTGPIIDKLVKNKFISAGQPDHQSLSTANTFLNNFLQKRPEGAKFVASDPASMRLLTERLIAFYLEPTQHYYGHYLPQLIQAAEKLVPGSVARLKQVHAENQRRLNIDPQQESINKLLSGESTPEMLIGEAAKYQINSRGRIYESAASKLVQQGHYDRARQVLEDNYSDDALENALANIKSNQISRYQNEGRFAEAEQLIDQMPESSRLSALINLANAAFAKNKDENGAYAGALLAKARGALPDRPENANEMGNLLQVVSAYSSIDPEEAFRTLSGLVPQLNELAEASIVVHGFQGGSHIRQGEMQMTNGNSLGFYIDESLFVRLAEKDFARTTALIDGFSRREIRIQMKLQLAGVGDKDLAAGRRFRNNFVIMGRH